jgi:AraC family transcriptional regulator, exoenzyme S synthesis regulatory protein ExsA
VFNIYDQIRNNPEFYRQLRSGDSLITLFNCLLENKYQDAWSHFNYFVYVVEGRRVWHTAQGAYELHQGSCIFVKKGACIVEQFFESASCFIFFFMPDDFICSALQSRSRPVIKTGNQFEPVIPIEDNPLTEAFFQSMIPYFSRSTEPDQALLELKFRELILTLADHPGNRDLHAYFFSLVQQPRSITLQQVMEENFCFKLKLEEFARLSARSLSAFKRDFNNLYSTSPGKWLLEKRLNHASHLLAYRGRTVSEAAYESGFENASHFSRAFRVQFGISPASVKADSNHLVC